MEATEGDYHYIYYVKLDGTDECWRRQIDDPAAPPEQLTSYDEVSAGMLKKFFDYRRTILQ